MAIGPGKYDEEATMVRERTKALGVMVIVLGGNKGEGFAAQFADETLMYHVPEMLRTMAQQIDDDIKRNTPEEIAHHSV